MVKMVVVNCFFSSKYFELVGDKALGLISGHAHLLIGWLVLENVLISLFLIVDILSEISGDASEISSALEKAKKCLSR